MKGIFQNYNYYNNANMVIKLELVDPVPTYKNWINLLLLWMYTYLHKNKFTELQAQG